jgi:hypothetical protein
MTKGFPFRLGQIVSTPGVLAAFPGASLYLVQCLERHQRGDWGTVCDDDKAANDAALKDGDRLLSAYPIDRRSHARALVITAWLRCRLVAFQGGKHFDRAVPFRDQGLNHWVGRRLRICLTA